jgi:hypothetical protein
MQLGESLRLLADLVRAPNDYYQHFARFPASLVFALSYGQPLNDDGKDLAELQKIVLTFVKDITPGAHLVDSFPILDLLPDFLSKWRVEAKQKHQHELEVSFRRPHILSFSSTLIYLVLWSTGFERQSENGERYWNGMFCCSPMGSTDKTKPDGRRAFLQYWFHRLLISTDCV